MQNSLLQACNVMLAAVQKEYCVPGQRIGFSNKGTKAELNRMFGVKELQLLLDGINPKDSVYGATNFGNIF